MTRSSARVGVLLAILGGACVQPIDVGSQQDTDAGDSTGGGNGSGGGTEADGGIPGTCDPLSQTGCQPGQKCAWVRDVVLPSAGHIECVPDGTVAVGNRCTYGDAGVTGYDNCAKGGACSSGFCLVICDLGASACTGQLTCRRYPGLFGRPTQETLGVCRGTQTGIISGEISDCQPVSGGACTGPYEGRYCFSDRLQHCETVANNCICVL
jgi:hypothetical protein